MKYRTFGYGHRAITVAMLLLLFVAFLVQCSDDSPTKSDPHQIDLHLKIASPDMVSQIQSVRITVIPVSGGDSIVVIWPVINGQYAGEVVGVPAGDVLVITEALASDGRVVYRGEMVVRVVPGEVADAEIEMQPYGAVVKLTPRNHSISAGSSFAVDIKAYGLPNAAHFACRLYYDSDLLRPDSAKAGGRLFNGSVMPFVLTDLLSADPPFYALDISSFSPSEAMVDDSGHATLATVFFSSGIPEIGSPLALTTEITVDSLRLVDIEGVDMDTAPVYRDLAVIAFTDFGVDLIPPAPVIDLKLDSASQSAAYLSWTAPGDDGYVGTVYQYMLRRSDSPITLLNWVLAQPITATPTVLPAGRNQVVATSGFSLVDTTYFALQSIDEAGNLSLLSNVAMGAAPDITPPSTISNLAISAQTSSDVTLTWTSPGDNATRGIASQYDIRHANSPITTANWAQATPVTGEPTPQIPGINQSMTMSVANNRIVYFAMKAGDEIPNWSLLSNVVTSTPPDANPPNNVVDLIVTEIGGSSVSLRWSAQGDDHQTGVASSYDLRYDTIVISEASFAGATPVANVPSPQAPGTLEYFTVTDLDSDTKYYFAIKIGDEALNWSSLSNTPTASTYDITAPGAITDLTAGDYTSTSVVLTWTSPGDSEDRDTATSYDLRWSYATITESNWSAATVITGVPAPNVAGTAETLTVNGLPTAGTYYFGIKTSDEAGNESLLSNNANLVMIVVTIPDAVLEAAIRQEISRPTGGLVAPDLVTVDSIDVDDLGVSDLTGLEYCPNLRFLQISWNTINDISPIADLANLQHLAMVDLMVTDLSTLGGLTGLSFLDLSGNRFVGNYAPVSELTWLDSLIVNTDSLVNVDFLEPMDGLVYLDISYSTVETLTPLADCPSLRHLILDYNSITDLSPLAGCPVLSILSMRNMPISDISPLTTLTELDTLYIGYSYVADLSPLVNNPGMGDGDFVDVSGCPLSENSVYLFIPALETRGVTVFWGEY